MGETPLPSANPASSGCVPARWPVEHVETRPIWCPGCEGNGHGTQQNGEAYLAARPAWFVSGYKRTPKPAAGMGGKSAPGSPGLMEQCSRCAHVYLDADDGSAVWWAERTERVVLAGAATSPPGSSERPLLLPASGDSTASGENREGDWWDKADTLQIVAKMFLEAGNIRCGWCAQARGTTSVPVPPRSWCDSSHEWESVGGHLIPSCARCAANREADHDWAPPRVAARKVARNLKRARLRLQQAAAELHRHQHAVAVARGEATR